MTRGCLSQEDDRGISRISAAPGCLGFFLAPSFDSAPSFGCSLVLSSFLSWRPFPSDHQWFLLLRAWRDAACVAGMLRAWRGAACMAGCCMRGRGATCMAGCCVRTGMLCPCWDAVCVAGMLRAWWDAACMVGMPRAWLGCCVYAWDAACVGGMLCACSAA